MSDETPTTTPASGAAMDIKDFDRLYHKAADYHRQKAERSGPVYNDAEAAPLIWHDQIFEREITPTGTVLCENTMRVGKTNNALDLILVASHANSGKITAASGATITIKTLQADTEDGTYEAVGPALCVTAPTDGISAEADALFCRVALGNFSKPWLKVQLAFSGTISGGTLDAALSYMPR